MPNDNKPNNIVFRPLSEDDRIRLEGLDSALHKIQKMRVKDDGGGPTQAELEDFAKLIKDAVEQSQPRPSMLGNAAVELNETEKEVLAVLEEMKRQGALITKASTPKTSGVTAEGDITPQPNLNIARLEDLTAQELSALKQIHDELARFSTKRTETVQKIRSGVADPQEIRVIKDELNKVNDLLGETLNQTENVKVQEATLAMADSLNRVDKALAKAELNQPKLEMKNAEVYAPDRLAGLERDVDAVLKQLGVSGLPRRIPGIQSPVRNATINNRLKPEVQKGPTSLSSALAVELTENTAQTFKSIIPSPSTLIDAMTTNSPALRAVFGMAKGLKDTRDRAKARIVDKTAFEDTFQKDSPEVVPQPQVGVTGELEEINRQQLAVMQQLLNTWTGGVAEDIKKQTEGQEELLGIEKDRERDNSYQATESLGIPDVSPTAVPIGPDGEEKPVDAGMGALGALFMGLSAFGATVTGVVGKVLPLIGKVGKMLRVGPLALLSALWDFGSGFFNAEEILDKETVSFTDRIQAGVSNIFGGVGRIVDMVAGWFGFDTGLGQILQEGYINLTQPIFDFFNDIGDILTEGITGDMNVTDAVKQFGSNMVDALVYSFDRAMNLFRDGMGTVSNVISEGWSNLKVMMNDSWTDWVVTPVTQMGVDMYNWFDNMRNTVVSSVSGVVNSVKGTFNGWVKNVQGAFSSAGNIGDQLSSAISGMFSNIFSKIASFGGADADAEVDSGVSRAIANLPQIINGFFSGIWNGMLDKIAGVVDSLPSMLVPDSVKELIEGARLETADGTTSASSMQIETDRTSEESRQRSFNNVESSKKAEEKDQLFQQQVQAYKAASGGREQSKSEGDTGSQGSSVAMQNNVNNSRVTNNSYVQSSLTTSNPRANSFRAQSLLAGT